MNSHIFGWWKPISLRITVSEIVKNILKVEILKQLSIFKHTSGNIEFDEMIGSGDMIVCC